MSHRILVIDDQITVTAMLEEALTTFGYRVKTASGGHEGLRLFENETFDAVITDLRMPDVDGHAVIRYIRNSDRAGTPIIGISGTPWLFEKDHADIVLSKPFTLRTLSDSLDSLICH